MSILAKLAKEIDESRNIGQTIAECQLVVWLSRKSQLQAEMSSDRGECSRRHRGASCRYTLRCPRKVKPLPWRKDMIVAADEQQKLGEKTLKHQADEEEEAAEIKNQVRHSNIEQPLY